MLSYRARIAFITRHIQQMGGLLGLAGNEHVGFTVPDIEASTQLFVYAIGCKLA